MGVHITPNHFYEPIPDTRTLKDGLWSEHSEMVGIEINKEAPINLLSEFRSRFKNEYEAFPRERTTIPHQYFVNNSAFGPVDGQIYYCMIRYFKPRKIIEVGTGYSTYLAAQAILKNKEEYGIDCELIAIDPYPNKTIEKGFPGLSKVIKSKVEDIDSSIFLELKENDILFIDSSHVLKIGNDVHHLYLEVLPRCNKGILIHIHDIFLPANYPRERVLKKYKFWNEDYLLQAFLTFNNAFEVVLMLLNLKHIDKLRRTFSAYDPQKVRPGSFWMVKKI
jgi:predicted O-methyltransferase YrrM